MLAVPAEPVQADQTGGIIGGMFLGALLNEAAKGNRARPRYYKPARPAAAVQADRDLQQALN